MPVLWSHRFYISSIDLNLFFSFWTITSDKDWGLLNNTVVLGYSESTIIKWNVVKLWLCFWKCSKHFVRHKKVFMWIFYFVNFRDTALLSECLIGISRWCIEFSYCYFYTHSNYLGVPLNIHLKHLNCAFIFPQVNVVVTKSPYPPSPFIHSLA